MRSVTMIYPCYRNWLLIIDNISLLYVHYIWLSGYSIVRKLSMPKNEYICDCKPINERLVEETKGKMLSDASYDKIAEFFKIVGDTTRCKIVTALSNSEMCVGDIANVLSMSKSSISHQLTKMKTAGVVKSRKSGKEVYYSLDDEHVAEIFALTVEHMEHIDR